MQMEMLCALRIVLLLDLKRHGSPVGESDCAPYPRGGVCL